MEAPPGYSQEFSIAEGCRIKRALYGLKQSPRAWFGRFTTAMKKFSYRQCNSDHTLFLKKGKDKITCLKIYVDDMGNLKYFLGIKVLRSKRGSFIHQRKYILDFLAESGMLDCKPAETPIVANHGLQILDGAKLANREQY